MSKVDLVIKQVKELLKKDTRGLTIQDIANTCRVSRVTASIALAKMDGMGLLYIRSIGKYKLHYLKSMDYKK
jgi:predicted transcriptional regulator of viral defense system